MMKIEKSELTKGLLILAGVAILTYAGVSYAKLNNKYKATLEENKTLATNLQVTTDAALNKEQELESEKKQLQDELDSYKADLSNLEKKNRTLDRKNDELTKLTTIDPELLKKYSKVFFLSENYEPRDLDDIDTDFVYDKSKNPQILSDIARDLDDLLQNAKDDDVNLLVLSAYRSFGTQASLKQGYNVTYGAGTANSFSAEQGYSEHQLGTAVDFTTTAIGSNIQTTFDQTEAYNWLRKNAYKYGFILSYPMGNTYYQYEPWHWRFVGKDLARYLDKKGKNFYDMDQRDIDEYLVDIFD